jgi:V8-like Glu-specific endopeptidase
MIRIASVTVGILIFAMVIFGLSGDRSSAASNNQTTPDSTIPGRENISSRSVETLSGSTNHGWTQEMMLAAQPYPLEIDPGESIVSLELTKPSGSPGIIPGSPPQVEGDIPTRIEERLASSQVTVSGYNYPPPFARYQNFDSYLVYPYSTVGKLFFRQGDNFYFCSAASIGNNGIWTAGHCIHKGDGTTWSRDVVFVPGYQNGNAPFGVWSADVLWITPEWFTSGDLRYDMGGVVLKPNGGFTISQVVGALGFAYNQANSLHWMNIAYPSSSPFNGATQQICAASFAYADANQSDPSPVAMGCDMTSGSSGGPWILDFSGPTSTQNYLNGNNSYRYSSHPKEIFSPYFDSDAKTLWDDLTDTMN